MSKVLNIAEKYAQASGGRSTDCNTVKEALVSSLPKEFSKGVDGIDTLKSREPVVPPNDFICRKAILKETSAALSFAETALVSPIIQALDIWLELFQIYGFNFTAYPVGKLVKVVLKTALDAVRVSVDAGDWLHYFKWKNAAFLSSWTGQELPPTKLMFSGNPKYLFGGPFYKFLGILKRRSEILSFAVSINLSKKGMPRPSDEYLLRSVEESYFTMTMPKTQETVVSQCDAKGLSLYYNVKNPTTPLDQLKREVRRTAREILSRSKDRFGFSGIVHHNVPSTSANVNSSKEKCGSIRDIGLSPAFAELQLNIGDVFEENPDFFRKELVKLDTHVTDYYGPRKAEILAELGYSRVLEVVGVSVDTAVLNPIFNRFFWQCVGLALKEKPLVRVVGLKESLKVRCITKGPPFTYFVLKGLQKSLLKAIQRFPQFQLTGRPCETSVLDRFFQDFYQGPGLFHSGDYKAATDELHSWGSEIVGEEITYVMNSAQEGLGDLFRPLIMNALIDHLYVTECGDGVREFWTSLGYNPEELFGARKQERGQLMGSIISFPVLCIINMSLIRFSLENVEKRKFYIHEVPSLINGDDCLTYTKSQDFHKFWAEHGSILGLENSVGKTFFSANFCTVNSLFFTTDQIEGRLHLSLVPYINMGLLTNQKRSASEDGDVSRHPYDLGRLMEPCIARAGPWGSVVRRHFLYRNYNSLKACEGPWFLPIWLCGLGLPSEDVNTAVTKYDLCKARSLLALYSDGKDIPSAKADKEWIFYEIYEGIKRDLCRDHAIPGSYMAFSGVVPLQSIKPSWLHDVTRTELYSKLVYLEWALKGHKVLLENNRKNGHNRDPLVYANSLWRKCVPASCPLAIDYIEPEAKPRTYPVTVRMSS